MGNSCVQWSKEDIISAFYNFYNKNNRSPITTEMLNKNGLPSWQYVQKIFGITKVDDFYFHIGLKRTKPTSHNKISEEVIKNECKRIFSILGRLPKKYEIEEMCPFSTKPFYNYGGIRKTFEYFEIYNERVKTEEEMIEDGISEILRISDKMNKSVTAEEYDMLKTKGYSRKILERKMSMKWNDILLKHSKYPLNIDSGITFNKDEIIKSLNNFKEKIGRVPFITEIKKYNVGYGRSKILEAFDVKTISAIYPIMGWDIYGSDILIMKESEILENFKYFVESNNRLPSADEYIKEINLFSKVTYESRYGSIKNLCKILDIDYIGMNNSCGAGTICYDNNGDMCKSLSEMNITNFLIENNIIYDKESYYNELIPNDKRRFDWKIYNNNKIYYIEYFGLYKDNPSKKFEIEYHDKTKNKIKELTDLGYYDKCIFLFPNQYYSGEYKDILFDKLKINH